MDTQTFLKLESTDNRYGISGYDDKHSMGGDNCHEGGCLGCLHDNHTEAAAFPVPSKRDASDAKRP